MNQFDYLLWRLEYLRILLATLIICAVMLLIRRRTGPRAYQLGAFGFLIIFSAIVAEKYVEVQGLRSLVPRAVFEIIVNGLMLILGFGAFISIMAVIVDRNAKASEDTEEGRALKREPE